MNRHALILLLFLLSYNLSISQKHKIPDTYNTKIDKANEVNVSGGNINIAKADTVFVGQLVVNQRVIDSIYFLGSTTVLDSEGIYTTAYKFAPKTTQINFSVNIQIEFDKPYLRYTDYIHLPPNSVSLVTASFKVYGENGDAQTSNMHSADFKYLQVRGVVSADNLIIEIKSKEKLFATIYGVVGGIKRL